MIFYQFFLSGLINTILKLKLFNLKKKKNHNGTTDSISESFSNSITQSIDHNDKVM